MVEGVTSTTTSYSTTGTYTGEGNLGLVINESLTNLNLNTVEYVPIISAVVVFSILLVIGAIAIIVFIAVLIRGRRKFKEFPFFVIVWHLTVTNAIDIAMTICTVLPCMLLEMGEEASKAEWYTWANRLIELAEQASLYFTLLMTINRFAVFVWPMMLIFFTRSRIMIMSFVVWFYVLFIVIWKTYSGTTKLFSRKTLSMQEILGKGVLSTFFTISSTVLPVVMLLMYCIIFAFIIKKKSLTSTNSSTEKDRSLLWQALAVTLTWELSRLTTMITPFASDSTTVFRWCWTIFTFSTTILNQMINPIIFLTMNKMVRSVLLGFFRTIDDSSNEYNSNPAQIRSKMGLISKIKNTLLNRQPLSRSTWITF